MLQNAGIKIIVTLVFYYPHSLKGFILIKLVLNTAAFSRPSTIADISSLRVDNSDIR